MKIHYLLFLPLLCFCSCATITRGVHEKLTVKSEPSGANVVLSTGEKGVTPAVFVKERRTENFTVTVSKAGYASQTVPVRSEFSSTGGTALVAGGLLTLISPAVDATSGAYKSLYPNPVVVNLVPTGKGGKKTEHSSAESQSAATPKPPSTSKPSPTAKPPKPKPSPTPTRKL
jgi:PEGA domain-containing protein